MRIDRRTFIGFAAAGAVTRGADAREVEGGKKHRAVNSASRYDFRQVDVFSSEPLRGNPLAVVFRADALSDDQMAALASWMNLSETAFLLEPRSTEADYRVRIFTR